MKKVKLYIASSLDGYIAKKDDNLDWLTQFPNPNQLDYGYSAFIKGVDTVIMGNRTYQEILGFGVDWPYADKQSYIFSRNKGLAIKSVNTVLFNEDVKEGVETLKRQDGKDIWLVGGGGLIGTFLELELIDEMTLTLIPTMLGEGIRLFPEINKETNFQLVESTAFENGIVNLVYRKK